MTLGPHLLGNTTQHAMANQFLEPVDQHMARHTEPA
jgi:hypothetical protein